jgi:hypothetical protein
MTILNDQRGSEHTTKRKSPLHVFVGPMTLRTLAATL